MDLSTTTKVPVGDRNKKLIVDIKRRALRSRGDGDLLACNADSAVLALGIGSVQPGMTEEILTKSTTANQRVEDNQTIRNRRGRKSQTNRSTHLAFGDDTMREELQAIGMNSASCKSATKSQSRNVTEAVAPVISPSAALFTEVGTMPRASLEHQGISGAVAQVAQESDGRKSQKSRLRRREKKRNDVSNFPHDSVSDPPTNEAAAKAVRKRGRPWPKSSTYSPEAVLATSNRLQEMSAIELQSAVSIRANATEQVSFSEKNRSRLVTPDPLSDVPDSVASLVRNRDHRTTSTSQARPKRKATSQRSQVTLMNGRGKPKAAGPASKILLSSIVGDASDDELSHVASANVLSTQ